MFLLPKLTIFFARDAELIEARRRDKAVPTTVFVHAGPAACLPQQAPLDRLFASLAAEIAAAAASGSPVGRHQPPAEFALLNQRVAQLISEYISSGSDDWRRYVAFNNVHYVRHLIDSNDDLELMLICWQPGQASHVHNHGDSHCWLTVMDGTVEELRYHEQPEAEEEQPNSARTLSRTPSGNIPMPGVLGTMEPCPMLTPGGVNAVAPGQTAYVNDNIALHAVRCPSTCPAPGAVTLHLYSPPITRVKLYEPDEDRVLLRTPGFFTIRGQRT